MSKHKMRMKPVARLRLEDAPDAFTIAAGGAPLDVQWRVLKHGETFALFDRFGDIHPLGSKGAPGIYHEGTRFLSRMELTIDGERPLLLNSAVDEENVLLTIDLTNPPLRRKGHREVPHGALHLARSKLLLDACCHEQLRITNYEDRPISVTLRIHFDADYADIFEVRGTLRQRWGRRLPGTAKPDGLVLAYEGLDGILRQTQIEASPHPDRIETDQIAFELCLQPREVSTIVLNTRCHLDDGPKTSVSYAEARDHLVDTARQFRRGLVRIETSNEQFNSWLERSYSDLFMLTTQTPHGLYPYAGIPWFSTVFGRDGIIAALECLWIAPELARGVLSFLAAHQAQQHDTQKEAQPGKILHEMRRGEMAALDEIPFGLYYGSVDSTPLFLLLASEYYQRTADRDFVQALWPHMRNALGWIRDYGDVDGDGFVEYQPHSEGGLVHQGWKDSHDAVFHADGSDAEPPIALCEVQAYVYAAQRGAAQIAHHLGNEEESRRLGQEAEQLRRRFGKAFWLEELQTYALALDAQKRPCRVRTSNAGHCLMAGIADDHQARLVTRTLLSKDHFSGWGIRTLDAREVRYNPMAYHNGSIWPHDNAIIAAGMARYGLRRAVHKVLGAMFDASLFVDMNRVPELFCGFARRRAQGPTLYPVACSPQAWAAGAVFLLLQSCLAIRVDALGGRVVFNRPLLPPFLEQVRLYDLQVGNASVDIHLYRYERDVGVHVVRKDGEVEVIVIK